jgi:Transposase IS4
MTLKLTVIVDLKVFQTLLSPLGTGYRIFADRFYTTRVWLEFLLDKRHYYTGTVQKNRKGFPVDIKTAKMAHMETRY